jgi:FAD/FMN-containing dehydrogenase
VAALQGAISNIDPRLARVGQVIGPDRVVITGSEMETYLRDWSGDGRGQALAVLRPATVGEVQACVRVCAETGLGIVPQGGNTGLVSGTVAEDGRDIVVLSLSRLNRIRAVDSANLTIDADAGCTLQAIKDASEAAGCIFPLALGAQGSCQIGGNVATNAGGINVLRYGMARDLVLGVEVVLPDGRLWNGMSGLRKDNRGYDLKQLFIGSEGTLGIVTGVGLKLFPRPENIETAYVGAASFEAAMSLLAVARRACSDMITAFEVMGSECLAMARLVDPAVVPPVGQNTPVHIIFELSSSRLIDARLLIETVLSEALASGVAIDAVVAQSQAHARAFWAIREDLVEGQARRGYHVRTDVSVRLGDVPGFIAAARKYIETQWPAWISQAYGHAGDGNVHFNVLPPENLAESEARRLGADVTAGLYDIVRAFGGSISAEHGIGRSRRDVFWAGLEPVQRNMLAAIKSAIDPQGLMNPGCLIPLAKEKT